MSRRRWFFGLLAISIVFDTLLKGHQYFAGFDLEYPLHIGGYLVLAGGRGLYGEPAFPRGARGGESGLPAVVDPAQLGRSQLGPARDIASASCTIQASKACTRSGSGASLRQAR
ncbi:hypothetical protein SAMN05444679_109239 [Variovorax sp. CF079]|nr:hypothetical protein SAMN05444679_109239 [Variovorax sp. CF079]